MRDNRRHKGFSLTEVLLSLGTLAIGMMFIAGVFPVGIHFATVTTERSIAAAAADEAFAKIRLIAADPCVPVFASEFAYNNSKNFELWVNTKRGALLEPLNVMEFAYPSNPGQFLSKKYFWSAVCRREDPTAVQVTVFVSRRIGSAGNYWIRDAFDQPPQATLERPVPIPINVNLPPSGRADELAIVDNFADLVSEETFINSGYTIVDNATGQIYRVLERYEPPFFGNVIRLDRPWQGTLPGAVWVVPPPVGGGRGPCVAVYQKVMRF